MLRPRRFPRPGLNNLIERDPGPLGPYRRPGVHGYAMTTEESIQRMADALAEHYARKRARVGKRRRVKLTR